MSRLNQMLESRLKAAANDPRRAAAVQAAQRAAGAGGDSEAVLAAAETAMRDTFVKSGARPSERAIEEQAFLAAGLAMTRANVPLKDVPGTFDSPKHYFLSGFLSAKVANMADVILPRGLAEKIGFGASMAAGFFKEVLDMAVGSGFDKQDLEVDAMGARRPFETDTEERG